jgi:hypothetical protein
MFFRLALFTSIIFTTDLAVAVLALADMVAQADYNTTEGTRFMVSSHTLRAAK